jgi:trans-aconitate 2-methyltransferase
MHAPRWSAERYARHAGPRLRPALDLLARVEIEHAERVVDLGCGAGALFPALRARFPGAALTGVDSSPAMLAKARDADAGATLVEADAASWRPAGPVDLIVANALLHWLPDHEGLVPDLLRRCRALAVQVPANFDAPSHRLVRELMGEPPWAERLAGIRLGDNLLPPARYHALLTAQGAIAVELWETIYWHALDGPDPVLDWLRGTTLLPIQAALAGAGTAAADTEAFERALGERLRAAYPADAKGVTLFPFRRLFFVATTGSGDALG